MPPKVRASRPAARRADDYSVTRRYRRRWSDAAEREAASGRSELLARLPDPLRHRCLCGAAPCSRIEAALVADPAVDPEHTFPVVEHVTGQRPGERVLVVCVDVYLHHPKRDRIGELLGARPAAAVEYVLEASAGIRGRERLLARSENLGAENHVAWGVGPVHVAECRRDQVSAALADTQSVGDA